jgi:hypothetical protein
MFMAEFGYFLILNAAKLQVSKSKVSGQSLLRARNESQNKKNKNTRSSQNSPTNESFSSSAYLISIFINDKLKGYTQTLLVNSLT